MALKKGKKNRDSSLPKLPLTSMLDMFTITLVFLLCCSTGKATMDLAKDLELPQSVSEHEYKDSVKLMLTQTELILGEEVIIKLKDGKIKEIDPENLQGSILYEKLKTYYDSMEEKKEGEENKEEDKRVVLFFCDKNISFESINSIIKTAGLAGYPNFQFMVLKK
ncbi:MAG: biopolymer transporter ExbD [bacterium]